VCSIRSSADPERLFSTRRPAKRTESCVRGRPLQAMRESVQSELDSVCVVVSARSGRHGGLFPEPRISTYGCDLDPIALGGSRRVSAGGRRPSALPSRRVHRDGRHEPPRRDALRRQRVPRMRSDSPAVGSRGSCRSKARSPSARAGASKTKVFGGTQRLVHVPHRWWADDTRQLRCRRRG